MNSNLLKTLVTNNLITESMEIDAFYKGKDLAWNSIVKARGTFTIKKIIYYKSGNIKVDSIDTIDGTARLIDVDDIYGIDGMPADRFGKSYGFNKNGEKMVFGAKRGRKSKNRDLENTDLEWDESVDNEEILLISNQLIPENDDEDDFDDIDENDYISKETAEMLGLRI